MKILLIHQFFLEEDDAGGSRFNEMARIWTDMGHEVTVLSGMVHYAESEKRPEYRGKRFYHRMHGKVSVWRCNVSGGYNINFLKRLWAYFAFVFSSLRVGLFKLKDN